MSEDLEELIKANGDDIEFEFFINGTNLSTSATLFEVHKQ